jgi:hypothetical protein
MQISAAAVYLVRTQFQPLTGAERMTIPSAPSYHPTARNLAVGLAHGDDVIPTNTVRCTDNREEVELIRRVLVDWRPRNIGFEPTVPKAIRACPPDSFSLTNHRAPSLSE